MGDELIYREGMRWLRDLKFYIDQMHAFNPQPGEWWCFTRTLRGYVTFAPRANHLYAFYYPVLRRMRFDRIGIHVHTASSTSGAKARLGIYADNGNFYPGKLILDAGEVDLTTTGQKEIEINVVLDRGVYWLAYVSNVSDAYLRMVFGYPTPKGFSLSVAYVYGSYVYNLGSYPSSLPDPYPSGAGKGEYTWVLLRVAEVLE